MQMYGILYNLSSCSPDNDPSVRRGEVSIDLTIVHIHYEEFMHNAHTRAFSRHVCNMYAHSYLENLSVCVLCSHQRMH